MTLRRSPSPTLLAWALFTGLTVSVSTATAQFDGGADPDLPATEPASVLEASTKLASLGTFRRSTARNSNIENTHPLLPLVDWAEQGQARIREEVRDYTCVLASRERVNGRLGPRVYMTAKVRHEQVEDGQVKVPFSLYLKFLAPEHLKDREVLFVAGQNDNKLLVRKGGRHLASLTASLEPTSVLAMAENRYPITEFGILRLADRLTEVGRREIAYGECEVHINDQFETKKRECTRIEIKHPVQRDHFEYCLARIYVDNEAQLPIRFESYLWPEADGEDPVPLEEYTYHDLQLNVGLTDADFDPSNPDYQFGTDAFGKL